MTEVAAKGFVQRFAMTYDTPGTRKILCHAVAGRLTWLDAANVLGRAYAKMVVSR